MRLHTLQLQAFLAFPSRERVDFDALDDAGLFLLTGRTGAGKTSVLDAICFALYGQVPGARGVRHLRCDQADPDVSTEVELEVTLRDRRLRIVRRPEQERPKVRGAGTTMAKAEVRLSRIDADGSESVLTTRPDEAGHELGGLLGMNAEQFCQVVMLPQGGFQKFLQSPTRDRIPLLRELFDVQRFSDIERWLDAERMRAIREAEAAMRELRNTVAAARHVANAGMTDAERAAPPEDWEAQPDLAVAWIDQQVVVAEAQHVTASTALSDTATLREQAETALATARTLADRQAAHGLARTELEQWVETRDARDSSEAELVLARRAAPAAARAEAWEERREAASLATATAIDALSAARRAGVPISGPDATCEELSTLADALRSDAGAAGALQELEIQVDRDVPALEALRRRTTAHAKQVERLETDLDEARSARPESISARDRARDATAALPGLVTAAETARERADRALLRDELAKRLDEARAVLLHAAEAAVEAAMAHVALQRRRLEGFAAELATRLAEGEACAVCGSIAHPSPAAAPEGGLVGEAALEAAAAHEADLARRREDLANAVADLQSQHAATEGVAGTDAAETLAAIAVEAEETRRRTEAVGAGLTAAEAALDANDASIGTLTQDLDDARLELARGTRDLEERGGALDDARARVEAARAGASSIEERVAQLHASADAATAAANALADAGRAEVEATRAQSAAQAAAAAAGFETLEALADALRDDEACAALEQALRGWDDTLAARRNAAEQEPLVAAAALPVPDMPLLSSALRNAKAAEGRAQDTLQGVLRRRSELRTLSEALTGTLERTQPLLERRATIVELAELACGKSTSNRLNMSLSTYVLAARLEEVAAAATVRLRGMTDGRYGLEHADDTAKGRSLGGLDLRVLDAWTGESRPPSTLSGGETFMASLALALGLADTVTAQSGGMRLDTLFVDEGFGSLDDEGTLDNVLEALDALREGGRTVGLVSHVAELRQRIPAQIRIAKGRRGSSITAPRVRSTQDDPGAPPAAAAHHT